MLIANIIPNDHPVSLRQRLMDASTILGKDARRTSVDNITAAIKISHPELFWSAEELVVLNKAWDAARIVRRSNEARAAELKHLLEKSTGGYVSVPA